MTQAIPRHIGYIVDGNRRWAKARGLKVYEGHEAGYQTLHDVILETIRAGVPYVSAYVFSTENWKRTKEEVGWLMGLLLRVLRSDAHIFIENNVRLKVIGTREGLSKPVLRAIDDIEAQTAELDGGELLLCLNYGGHQEIVDAVKGVIAEGTVSEDVTPELLGRHMYAPDVPPCDLIVRTSGEQRLSNFMLWHSAYSELMFIDKPWPDMTKQDVHDILKEYARRARRFGG